MNRRRTAVAVLVALVVLTSLSLASAAVTVVARPLAGARLFQMATGLNQGGALVRVYVIPGQNIYLVNVNGVDAMSCMIVGATLKDVCLSRDGQSIAVLTDFNLMVTDTRGRKLREPATNLGAVQPKKIGWSWDGRYILFSSEEGLYKVPAYGRNATLEVVPVEYKGNLGSFAAGPGYLIYEDVFFATTLRRFDEATGESRAFVPGYQDDEGVFLEDGSWSSPTISPDGTMVAYTHRVDEANADWLYVISAEGQGEGIRLYGLDVQEPYWLPDWTIDAVHPEPWLDLDDVWHYDEALVNLAGDGTSIVTILAKAEPGIAHPSGAYVRRNLRLVR